MIDIRWGNPLDGAGILTDDPYVPAPEDRLSRDLTAADGDQSTANHRLITKLDVDKPLIATSLTLELSNAGLGQASGGIRVMPIRPDKDWLKLIIIRETIEVEVALREAG